MILLVGWSFGKLYVATVSKVTQIADWWAVFYSRWETTFLGELIISAERVGLKKKLKGFDWKLICLKNCLKKLSEFWEQMNHFSHRDKKKLLAKDSGAISISNLSLIYEQKDLNWNPSIKNYFWLKIEVENMKLCCALRVKVVTAAER